MFRSPSAAINSGFDRISSGIDKTTKFAVKIEFSAAVRNVWYKSPHKSNVFGTMPREYENEGENNILIRITGNNLAHNKAEKCLRKTFNQMPTKGS